MNMILFTINLLIVSLLSTKKTLFRDPAVLENENDPDRDTIYGEFIIFFEACWTQDMINALSERFKECYSINNEMVDVLPDIVDHWIYMDKKSGCDYEDEIEIQWDDYCIKSIEEDERVQPSGGNRCLSRSVEPALWNLNTVCPAISNGIQYIKYDSSYPLNMDIVVMDSGIDTSHSQFVGITIQRIYDAYPDQPALQSHGTHCSGTILGKDYGAFRVDSNTQIKLIDVRIFPTIGATSSATVLNGYDSIINYLNQNPGKKVIINMSFGGGNWVEKDNRLATIRSKGGISIAAAGNNNYDAANKSPASSPDTITVGAIDQNNNKASFSNYGGSVDIWAPGVSIKSAVVGGGTEVWQGTSMATPLVVGIAANILANNPNLDFNGIKQKLLNYAVKDVNDENGNTNLPRVQALCEEYSGCDSECVCDNGYIDNNGFCADINECLNPDVCGDNTHCINHEGSFECKCLSGFEGDCKCLSGVEGFECYCLSGFEGDAITIGCTDIDECANDNDNNCATNNGAQCINQPGNYVCECLHGFVGDPTDVCTEYCITSCEGRDDGNYHSCSSCSVFNSCSGGYITENRACANAQPPLEYDAILNACTWEGESQSCHSAYNAKSVLNEFDFSVDSSIVKGTKDNHMFGYISMIALVLFILINNILIGLWCLCKRNNKNNAYYKANIVIDTSSDNESNEINV